MNLHKLSPREVDVLTLVSHGLRGKEIAVELGIGHQTVKNHCAVLKSRLQAQTMEQAVAIALRKDIIQ